ncbi:MAG: 6-carboxytetrahydropterin synthase [Phycisphaerales bacterium]
MNPDGSAAGIDGDSGVPAMSGLGRFYELVVACRGEPHPDSGYLVNIKAIDRAVRSAAVPLIAAACRERPTTHPGVLLPEIARATAASLPVDLESVRWNLSPHLSMEVRVPTTNPPAVLVRQHFDLACAHRLHDPKLTDEQNREVFGKCNNPNGHGHNYRVEPCVRVGFSDAGDPALTVLELESVVDAAIVHPFDHTHLNEDTREFAPGTGLNPSVENIARVFYERLAPAVRGASGLAELVSVTVWETDRTCCTYPG